jgi:pimeloyl-ACP methyl ester carboxylesterase
MGPERSIDVAGIKTRYHEAGSGEPVVFIYGGNFGSADSGSNAFTWNLNLPALAQRYRAIAFDKVGQGYTDNPLNDDYTMAAVVRHATAFIETLKLPPVHLVGHSRGGYCAARVTLERPELVRSLTIINSGTLSPGVSTNEVVLSKPPFPSFTRESARWVYENYCFRREAVTEDWVEAVVAALNTPKYRESVRKMEDEQLRAKLFLPQLARDKRETLTWINEGRLQRPTQIVWGGNDRTILLDRGVEIFEMMAAQNRRTDFHVINHSGHFPFRENPERFNALLGGFVALHSH